MNHPTYGYPYPPQGYWQAPPMMAPPMMATPQYAAAPPTRRKFGFLEGCLCGFRCCCLIDQCCCDPSICFFV